MEIIFGEVLILPQISYYFSNLTSKNNHFHKYLKFKMKILNFFKSLINVELLIEVCKSKYTF